MDFRKVFEVLAALVSAAIGFLLMARPHTLLVYGTVFGAEDRVSYGFGLSMMLASMLHSIALYVNGGAPRCSRWVRIIACTWHLAISLVFLINFWQAGYYLSIVYVSLIIVIVAGALHRSIYPDWRGYAWMWPRNRSNDAL